MVGVLPACMSVYYMYARYSQRPEEPLELEMQMVVSHH